MSSAAILSSPRSRPSDDLSPSTVRFTAPSTQDLRPAATVVIVVSTRADEQEQLTQNLLKQGYRLQTEGSADGDDAATALRKVYASLGNRFGGETRLPAVLVQSETGATPSPPREVLTFAGLRLDRRRREVRVAGSLVDLTKTEFDVLFFLASEPGEVLTRDEIVHGVKGEGHPVTPRSVDVQLVNLRRKLGALSGQLQTNRGVGYRFVDSGSR